MTGPRSCTIAWTRSIRAPTWLGLNRAATSWCTRTSPTLQRTCWRPRADVAVEVWTAGTPSACALGSDGGIADVLWNGPADKAQLAPGEKIIAVDGKIFSNDALRDAIRKAKGSTEPIHLIVQADSFVHTAEIDYHDGERYPALERVEGTPDYLDDITKPLTTPEKVPEEPKKDDE